MLAMIVYARLNASHTRMRVVDMIGAPAGVNTAVGLAAGTAAAANMAVAGNQDALLLNTPGAT